MLSPPLPITRTLFTSTTCLPPCIAPLSRYARAFGASWEETHAFRVCENGRACALTFMLIAVFRFVRTRGVCWVVKARGRSRASAMHWRYKTEDACRPMRAGRAIGRCASPRSLLKLRKAVRDPGWTREGFVCSIEATPPAGGNFFFDQLSSTGAWTSG